MRLNKAEGGLLFTRLKTMSVLGYSLGDRILAIRYWGLTLCFQNLQFITVEQHLEGEENNNINIVPLLI